MNRLSAFFWGLAVATLPAAEPASDDSPPPLMGLSLQELRNVEVTSVSRKEESLLNAPAAVYVISNEDLRRSGHTTIAESLRMSPGMDVARISANKWAVSARGFNSRFANKQLVLMDGRTLYTPVFSGLYWDAVDTFLDDVDRVEVVRGPGGTAWGANAVNGVVNIISKDAAETQGTAVTAGYGNEEQGFGGIRYGGLLAPEWHYRVYAKGRNHDDFRRTTGGEAPDEWWQQREGFRIDWDPEASRHLTIQGDYYYGRSGDEYLLAYPDAPRVRTTQEDGRAIGWNLLSRWTQTVSENIDYTLQFYYDRNQRRTLAVDVKLDTLDLDFQSKILLGERNELQWGVGYRQLLQDLGGTYTAVYKPEWQNDQLYSIFLQDEFAIVPERLWFTAGSKFEHNDFTGWELQPSARLTYKPTENQTLWAAISRAVRTPALFERTLDARVAVTPSVIANIRSLPSYESEEVTALETGYRIQATPKFFVDVTGFYNVYDRLRTTEILSTTPGSPTILEYTYGNYMEGNTYGAEVAPTWQVTESWRLSAGYTWLQMDLRAPGSSDPTAGSRTEGESPQHQFHARSFLDLPHRVQFDTAVYFVEELPNLRVPSYVRLDARLGWSPVENLDLSIVVQNILDSGHREFGAATLVTPVEIERSIYGKITWRF